MTSPHLLCVVNTPLRNVTIAGHRITAAEYAVSEYDVLLCIGNLQQCRIELARVADSSAAA